LRRDCVTAAFARSGTSIVPERDYLFNTSDIRTFEYFKIFVLHIYSLKCIVITNNLIRRNNGAAVRGSYLRERCAA